LSEQLRPANSRGYRKVKRADDEQRTRARIVDAVEQLHGLVGPARASVSAIADRAGVTRATVYRHFPDDEALFLACSGQWLSRQRLPDPQHWATYEDPWTRLRAGLLDIYRFYRAGEQMLAMIQRDAEVVPERVRVARLSRERLWRTTLLRDLPGHRRATCRAAVAHATAFTTWRSLCLEEGLTDRAAADLMVAMTAAASPG
jgi:AcrR family transcriptional regulator